MGNGNQDQDGQLYGHEKYWLIIQTFIMMGARTKKSQA